MKNAKYEHLYELYKQGFSLADIGKMEGIRRQCVYEGFKRRGFKLRTKNKLPYLTYKNIKFTLRNNGYYARTDGNRQLMHRYVWETERGEIPKNHDIHHIDGDKTNNFIDNLECLLKSEHTKKYSPHHNQYTKNV